MRRHSRGQSQTVQCWAACLALASCMLLSFCTHSLAAGTFYCFAVSLAGTQVQVVWPQAIGGVVVSTTNFDIQKSANSTFTSPTTLASPTIASFSPTEYTATDPVVGAANFYRVVAYTSRLPDVIEAISSAFQPVNYTGVFAYPPPYGIAAPCGTDWATACGALSDALQQALSGSPATAQIWAGPGTYTGTGNNAPLAIGTGTVITLQSLVGEVDTIIDLGGGTRAFDFNNPPALTTLSGFTIRNGQDAGGGAIQISGAVSLVLSHLILYNNQASAGSFGGGAIAVLGGVVTLTYITFATNTADSGGGLAATTSSITMSDCYFINNIAQASGTGRGGALLFTTVQLNAMQNVWMETNTAGLDGGAMHIEGPGQVSTNLINITMIGNHAKSFGGALNLASINMTIRDSLVANNVADLYGGGLFSFFAGLYLFNVNVTGNSAPFGSGGLKALQGAILMWDCIISGNTAAAGAGIQVDKNVGGGPVPAYIQATNSQIINNVATTQGGGINAATCDGVVLYNTEVSGNFAPSGGAIWFGGDDAANSNTISLTGCTVNTNNAQYGGALYGAAGARMLIQSSTFSQNTAKSSGSVLLADNDSEISFANSALINNGNYSCYDPPTFGGAISIGIDQFNPAGAASCNGSTATVPAQVQVSGSQITNNVASDSGGGIYMLSGALGLTDTVVQGNTAGSADGSTGLGGGLFMGDKCSGGACTSVGAILQNVTFSVNYAHLAGGALFFEGLNSGSSLTLKASLVSNNYVDSSFTGSTSPGLGGGLTILHNNFDVEDLVLEGNSAYYGGAIFVSADLSSNATFRNLTFTNNIAAEGSSQYWLYGSSPLTPLNCIDCSTLPGTGSPFATEPLHIASDGNPPSSVVSAEVANTFSLALEDYYGAVATATNGGTCSINSPSNDILLGEAGRFALIQSGVSVFTQFEVTGGIGSSYTLSATCSPSSAGQLSYLPSTYSLTPLALPLSVAQCDQGTEQNGEFCRECSLDFYSFTGLSCLACPYGGFCPGGTNGEQTPILSEMNFWRSSANATQLYRCPGSSCMGTPQYSGQDVGDAACTNGTRGPVCAVCDQDYYLFSGACSPCQSVGKASLAAAIIVVTAALILIFLFDLPGGDDVGPGPMNKYKIITTHFQLMSLLRDYDVTWPSSTIQLLSYSDSLNLGISITAPQCFVPGYNFFVFYIATMAQPALAAMLCAGVYLLVHVIYVFVSVPRGREGQVTLVCCGAPMAEAKRKKLVTRLSKIKARCYKNVFYLVTLVYPRCAQTCLQLFSVTKLDIGSFLSADFTITVRDTAGHWGKVYMRYLGPGIALMLLFAIGLPIWYFYIMWTVRTRLKEPEIMQRFGFLYGGYSFQYWETVDMMRKLLIGAIPVFVAVQPQGSLQAVIGQLSLVGTGAATIWIMPFMDYWDNVISITSMGVLWLLLLTGEMMKWAHLSDFQVNGIAAAQLTLTSGVAAVVMTAVAYGLALKARALYKKHHKAAWAMIRKKFPGNFKIMDESLAGSESDSAPATGRTGSHSKGEAKLDAAIRDKEGSFTTRGRDTETGDHGELIGSSMSAHDPMSSSLLQPSNGQSENL